MLNQIYKPNLTLNTPLRHDITISSLPHKKTRYAHLPRQINKSHIAYSQLHTTSNLSQNDANIPITGIVYNFKILINILFKKSSLL